MRFCVPGVIFPEGVRCDGGCGKGSSGRSVQVFASLQRAMEKGAGQSMESLAKRFRSSVSLLEKEMGGIKIAKKDTDGALLGFHHNIVAELFSTKAINENGFIDQFTSLWRGKVGV